MQTRNKILRTASKKLAEKSKITEKEAAQEVFCFINSIEFS